MTFLSYPRLGSADASQLLLELTDAEPAVRAETGRAYRGRASKYETATNLVTDDQLDRIRKEIVGLAEANGFPDAPARSGFDAGLPHLLDEHLFLSPAEAGSVEIWNYLSLVVVPDVALWRWPNENKNPSYERLIGKPRNVLRRHWWRARLLGTELPGEMGEDEIVQIVERPSTLGGDPRVARAVASAFVRYVATHEIVQEGSPRSIKRMEYMRDLAKRVLRIGRVVVLSTVTDEDLTALVDELAEAAGVAQATARGGEIRALVAVDPPPVAAVAPTVTAPEPVLTAGAEVVAPVPVEAPVLNVEPMFNQDMQRLGQRAESELGLNPGPLRRLLADFGGVQAARRVLAGEDPEWFSTVMRWGRPDLTVESVVVKPEYSDLFDAEERAIALDRLEPRSRPRDGDSV